MSSQSPGAMHATLVSTLDQLQSYALDVKEGRRGAPINHTLSDNPEALVLASESVMHNFTKGLMQVRADLTTPVLNRELMDEGELPMRQPKSYYHPAFTTYVGLLVGDIQWLSNLLVTWVNAQPEHEYATIATSNAYDELSEANKAIKRMGRYYLDGQTFDVAQCEEEECRAVPVKRGLCLEHSKLCKKETCDDDVYAKDKCERHYRRDYMRAYRKRNRQCQPTRPVTMRALGGHV